MINLTENMIEKDEEEYGDDDGELIDDDDDEDDDDESVTLRTKPTDDNVDVDNDDDDAFLISQVFKDPTEKIVEFTRINVWHIGETNTIEYELPYGYEEAGNDWIGLFKVSYFRHLLCLNPNMIL